MAPTSATASEAKPGFFRLLLWAFGLRTASADSGYGERLAAYRRRTSKPVALGALLVFLLVVIKIGFVLTALVSGFLSLDAEAEVLSHDLSTPPGEIFIGVILELLWHSLHSFPLWLQMPMLVLWFAVFVADFLVAAYLADNRKSWLKAHWGGIPVALVTIP